MSERYSVLAEVYDKARELGEKIRVCPHCGYNMPKDTRPSERDSVLDEALNK